MIFLTSKQALNKGLSGQGMPGLHLENLRGGGGGGGGGGAKIGFQKLWEGGGGRMHLATLHSNHVICIVGVSRGGGGGEICQGGRDFVKGG